MILRCLMLFLIATGAVFAKRGDAAKRLDAAAMMFQEIMDTADNAVPQNLLDKAHCAVLVPGLKKGAFIVGAKYGKGYMFCRTEEKTWGAPASMRVEGGSFGFQIGGSETDVVLLVMNEAGVQKLLSSRFTVGGEGSVAAGPVGRQTTAQTDAMMRAQILSWSRSRGAFAGVSLQGATLREDLEDNQDLYGREVSNRDIVAGKVEPPAPAEKVLSLLKKYSPRKLK